ncbi:MAG TPA: YggS family pyridoxal phosphate-dependent enzyme [Spirochaetota bacterium]|nr:YggS family pyridoxal phosphate-dependent enzyme [Spirochaetota bacterium]HPS86367.1 YggS family pyridoxal phosphate-dependent enzyme [Spirochaetota bacterium]
MTIIDNYNKIKDTINETALKCGRNPDMIKIISVSKTFDMLTIQEAIDSGIRIFGENRIQEANEKFPQLKGNFELHMIGHLQSNKAREAVSLFEVIHSIDKVSTALKLDSEAEKKGKIQRVLIQLKTTDEVTKSGAGQSEIFSIAESISGMKNLKLEGLMSIGPNTADKNLIRKSFIETAETLDIINSRLNLSLKELSMGMSGDYTIAIEEGATIVRIGSAIFGNRDYTI